MKRTNHEKDWQEFYARDRVHGTATEEKQVVRGAIVFSAVVVVVYLILWLVGWLLF